MPVSLPSSKVDVSLKIPSRKNEFVGKMSSEETIAQRQEEQGTVDVEEALRNLAETEGWMEANKPAPVKVEVAA